MITNISLLLFKGVIDLVQALKFFRIACKNFNTIDLLLLSKPLYNLGFFFKKIFTTTIG